MLVRSCVQPGDTASHRYPLQVRAEDIVEIGNRDDDRFVFEGPAFSRQVGSMGNGASSCRRPAKDERR